MKESTGKKGKRILPVALGVVLLLGCLVFLGPFKKGPFLNAPQTAAPDGGQVSGLTSGQASSGRYKIMDRGYREMAVSFMMNSLYARPLEMDNLRQAAAYLAPNLGIDEKELIRDLKAERGFVWLGRRLPESSSVPILQKELPGVYAVKEAQRYYPGGRGGAHVVGFMEEEQGLAGVESFYDGMLGGGFSFGVGGKGRKRGDLLLTIDLPIQQMMEDNLHALQQETGAVAATGLVLDYETGAILAMASLPGFDPNRYWEASKDERLNRTTAATVGPDSLQRLFSFAAEYDRLGAGKQDPLAAVKRDLQLEKNPVRTYRQWFNAVEGGFLSPELMSWPAEMQAEEHFQAEFERRLGVYGQSTVDLPGTTGQAVGPGGNSTPVQILGALSALVNGGRKIVPHLGRAVLNPQNGQLELLEHLGSGTVVRPDTAKRVVAMLKAASLSPAGTVVVESLVKSGPETAEARGREDYGTADPAELSPASYRTMLLSFTTRRAPGLAMFISLEQAALATGEKTPMRIAGEKMLVRMQELARVELANPGLQSLALREAKIYDDWLKSRQVSRELVVAESVGERQNVMPDLKGFSVRKALRILQPLALKIKIVGSGRIVAQLPQPGLKIGKGACVLTLQSDN